jgi:hypothetical protein
MCIRARLNAQNYCTHTSRQNLTLDYDKDLRALKSSRVLTSSNILYKCCALHTRIPTFHVLLHPRFYDSGYRRLTTSPSRVVCSLHYHTLNLPRQKDVNPPSPEFYTLSTKYQSNYHKQSPELTLAHSRHGIHLIQPPHRTRIIKLLINLATKNPTSSATYLRHLINKHLWSSIRPRSSSRRPYQVRPG